MTKTVRGSFVESMSLSDSDVEDSPTLHRRIATYSVESLRVASQVDKTYVQYPDFVRAIQVMDRLFQLGTELDMPQGAFIEGPTGVGKTALFRYFQESVPKSTLFSPGMGVVGLRVPQRPRTGHFVSGLLRAIRYPFSTGSTPQLYQRRHIVVEGLRAAGTRLIFLDEAQHLLQQLRGPSLHDWECESTEFLRQIMDEGRISMVLAGSEGMDKLEETSKAFSSRLPVRERLKNFDRDATWVGFVRAFSKQCKPFDLTFLCEPAITTRLHYACGGNLRAFKRHVTEAVLLAVDAGALKLDAALLSQAFQITFGSATIRSNPFA
ncbi:AAA family ATPase [Hydrogenophaga sp. D2P1]|uniref:AAA family ATPase n=1 Tax=Hydrogenophaga aromaticivorans TaxID=2610898 RepID=A0A7Y8KX87_9BURK|nr:MULTISPECIES: TniB family NTP-binding protein [Hydrogenophaga]NWF46335.1 AAA family ATPase [Hydrogenophaga aromaticivorans]UCU93399.1 TniB family NTP-binding protein [Hydrogenophaga taeniospiralis]